MCENAKNINYWEFKIYKELLIKFVEKGQLDLDNLDAETVKSFNGFLSKGKGYCLKIVDKFHQEEIGYISGWKIWGIHNNIESENIDLMLELVWVAFEKQMDITGWHPWDGQFSIEEEDEALQLWLKGYYRYVARTGNYQGFASSGHNYKHNDQYLSDIKEFLTVNEFEAQVLNICRVFKHLNGKDVRLIKNVVEQKNSISEISKSICSVCSISEYEWATFNIEIALGNTD